MPLLLRRCLLGNLSGTLVVAERGERRWTHTIHVRDRAVVCVTSTERVPRPGERAESYVTERVCSLFHVRDAEAAYEHSTSPVVGLTANVPLPDLLLEGLRSVTDDAVVRRWAGDLDEELAPKTDPFSVFRESTLGPAEGFFLSRMVEPTTTRRILEASSVDAALALRLVCALRFAGVLAPTGVPREWIGDRDPFERSASSAPGVAASAAGVDISEAARICYMADEKLRAIRAGADYYVLLEVERRAAPDKIKTSYRELVKLFHPDRHAQLAAFDRDIKHRLESIFAALTTAYNVLGHLGEREAYDQKLARQDQSSARPAPATPSRPAVPEPKPPKGGPVRPDTSGGTPRPEPRPAAPTRSASPPIPIPIVPPLSRRPPKPPKPPTVSPQPAFAAEPQRPLAPAPPPVSPEQLVEHGRAYAESGDHERALQAFQRAVLLLPSDAEVHAALGRALFNLHGLTRQSEAALRKAIELDPGTAELYVELAAMYRSAERDAEARTVLKRALTLDPLNVEARAALTALGVRISDPSDGFFRRFFKK